MQREKDCHREPDRHYEQRLPETGSDYPAVAVRPWRNEGNVSLAEESAAAVSDNACGGARTENIQNAAVAGENPSAKQDVYGHSAGDGGSMGVSMAYGDKQPTIAEIMIKLSDDELIEALQYIRDENGEKVSLIELKHCLRETVRRIHESRPA